MSANSNQKLKLLYVYKMLNEETDAEHGLSMTQILERLAQVGISAERKGIYRDIDVLRSFGFTITTIQHVPVEYTLEHKGMSTAELVLLADAVQSSVFVDEQTSNKLVESICNLAPVHEQEQLKKQVFVNKRIQSQSESVFYKVDAIQEAMRSGCKVAFTYFKYDNAMQRRFLNGGEPFVLTPVRVVLSDGCYYLVTWSDKHECFVRFRVDRMDAVSVSQEPVTQNDAIAGYTLQDFENQVFGVSDGEPKNVRLLVERNAMDMVVDRFGIGLKPRELEDGYAEVSVTVRISPVFFGWIAGTNGAVRIAGPKELVQEYKDWLAALVAAM